MALLGLDSSENVVKSGSGPFGYDYAGEIHRYNVIMFGSSTLRYMDLYQGDTDIENV